MKKVFISPSLPRQDVFDILADVTLSMRDIQIYGFHPIVPQLANYIRLSLAYTGSPISKVLANYATINGLTFRYHGEH